jgi:hypothetical protein
MAILEEAAMVETPGLPTPGMGAGPGPDIPGGNPIEQEVMQLLQLREEIDQRLAMLTGGGGGVDPAMAGANPAMAGVNPAMAGIDPAMAAMPQAGGLLG